MQADMASHRFFSFFKKRRLYFIDDLLSIGDLLEGFFFSFFIDIFRAIGQNQEG